MKDVYVAGIGVVSSIGDNYTFWDSLAKGKSGIRPVEIRDPNTGSLITVPYGRPDPELVEYIFRQSCVNVDPARVRGLASKYAIAAVRQALSKNNHFLGAGYEIRDPRLEDAWLFVGTSSANLHLVGRGLAGDGKVPDSPQGLPATYVAMNEGIGGRRLTISTACCSSTDAIGLAYEAVRDRHCETAIAVGTEGDYLDERLTAALQYEVQSKSGVCRPFDRRRDGGVFAEGAAAIVLTSEPEFRWKELKCVGYASLNSAAHPTHADAKAIAECMRRVTCGRELCKYDSRWIGRSGEIFEESLVYLTDPVGFSRPVIISPHAGGTVQGDEVMAKAMKEIFAWYHETTEFQPWCYNSRPLHGHAIGASGIIETIGLLMCLKLMMIPPSPVENSEFPWIKSPVKLEHIPEPQHFSERILGMKVSVGMGGSCSCLVFERAKPVA